MLELKSPRNDLKYAMADTLSILAELMGTNDYPATRSLPPIIFGIMYGSHKTMFAMYLTDELVLIFRLNLGVMKKVLDD